MPSFHPYPSYRQTDLPWLGQIPAHWDVKRLKWTIEYCQNGAWGDEPNGIDDVACVRVADFDRTKFRVNFPVPTLRALPKAERRNKSLRKGDLLLEKSGGGDLQPVGFIVLYDSDEPAICSNFVARMPVRENYDPNFLCYLHASLYSGKINTQSIKQNTGIQNLDSVAYLNEKVPLPPLSEQQAIAAYLDRQTAKIDALSAKKQRLLDLLAEQRAALISQAVTKGLNPAVKMKNSGATWLGQVPSHWDVTKLGYASTSLQTGPFGSQIHSSEYVSGGIPLVNPAHIKDGKIYPSEEAAVDQETWKKLSRHELLEGDIVFARRGEMGRCALVTEIESGWLCGTGSIRVRPNKSLVFPEYLSWALSTKGISDWLSLESVGTTMENLNTKILASIPLSLPPIKEQEEIVEHLNYQTKQLTELANKIETAIECLREYRAALISSAVTGKIKVQG